MVIWCILSGVSSGLMLSLSRSMVAEPGKPVWAPVRGVAPEVMLSIPGVIDPAVPPGVRNGVESRVLGVTTELLLGVAPLKSTVPVSGAFVPPISGVSTCVSAIKFCASCKILSTTGAGVRGVRRAAL